MARRPSETLFRRPATFANALSVAPAQAGARPEAQLQLFEHVGFRQNAQTTEAVLRPNSLRRAEKGDPQRDRPVCFMKIVDFMRTITPFHGVHTYADTNRRRYD